MPAMDSIQDLLARGRHCFTTEEARDALGSDLDCGSIHVQFVARRDMEATYVVHRNTETGVLRSAPPEATALEVVCYPRHWGSRDPHAAEIARIETAVNRRCGGPGLV